MKTGTKNRPQHPIENSMCSGQLVQNKNILSTVRYPEEIWLPLQFFFIDFFAHI